MKSIVRVADGREIVREVVHDLVRDAVRDVAREVVPELLSDRCSIRFPTTRANGNGSRALALMASGAVLRFVVFHRDFEHVVAADADAMNPGAGAGCLMSARVPRIRWRRRLGLCLRRFAHIRILARSAIPRPSYATCPRSSSSSTFATISPTLTGR